MDGEKNIVRLSPFPAAGNMGKKRVNEPVFPRFAGKGNNTFSKNRKEFENEEKEKFENSLFPSERI